MNLKQVLRCPQRQNKKIVVLEYHDGLNESVTELQRGYKEGLLEEFF